LYSHLRNIFITLHKYTKDTLGEVENCQQKRGGRETRREIYKCNPGIVFGLFGFSRPIKTNAKTNQYQLFVIEFSNSELFI
jgi:hypothetical protein